MRPDKDKSNEFGDEEASQGLGIEPTPGGFAHWVAEQYLGDDRFESIEVQDPGPLEEEAVRVKFICDSQTHFLVSVLQDDAIVRIGLATESKGLVARLEAAAEEVGGALSDLLAEGMDIDEDVEHEVEHFHDDEDYYCSDLHYQRDEDLFTEILRDEIIFYLDGYISAFYEYVFEEED